jgi:ERCC4-type nuclease
MQICHPNNLKFVEHFERLRQTANSCNNMNLSKGYAAIILSIRKYPLPITTLAQAESLTGVGSGFLNEFQPFLTADSAGPEPNHEVKEALKSRLEQLAYDIGGFPALVSSGESEDSDQEGTKRQKVSTFSPSIGTPAWACLVVLHLHSADSSEGMALSDLKSKVRDFNEKYPKSSKFNDKSVQTLAKRGILTISGGGVFEPPACVRLTDIGRASAAALWQRSLRRENLASLLNLDLPPMGPAQTSSSSQAPSFELVMLLDNREFAVSTVLEVLNPGIKVEQRSLPIGDITWIWRSTRSDEYMAGTVVERKAIEDLSTSIKDGRYEEQRRRLAKAPGIDKIVYIIEGIYSEAAQRNPGLLPEASISTAMRHTDLTENFYLLTTANAEQTAELLIEIHARIASIPPEEISEDPVTYRDFTSDTHKSNSLTVAQYTSRVLRSIPGIGNEAVVTLNEFFSKTGKGGLKLGNIVEALKDPNINATVKAVTGAKRIPLSGGALFNLMKQYGDQ